ncbi:TIGR04222 domain-containing membrane protein [Fimbriiglobus ruber]|uniref:TIGR04222 domain-containing membrane protein n=1 Tax=Fimbriiglobus ruber TaxID=1908690 RepID=A0A225DXK0_9BACT|nr:TIGR04222 domain-containing membrane protein [Fimbriiglobus ruber]OWK45683.1 hypothetical protein FRUB_02014 [Fimbriiglobus ruber]
MTSSDDLLRRIEEFDIDGTPSPALPFAARLARENGWSLAFATRVVAEYKRFMYLAVSHGTVCPSEEVDQAWHLHLTYTRSYWTRFCADVLGRPVHHDPTRGGAAEGDKHLRMYADTLAAYRQVFGTEPPADVWPPAGERFGESAQHRVVNTARNWVVPKAPVHRGAAAVGLAVAVVAGVGCAGAMDPFQLVGADFLFALIPIMIAAILVGRVLRNILRTPNPQPGDEDLSLGWAETAYLAGGIPRLATAAITRLVAAGGARVDPDGRLVPLYPAPAGLGEVEAMVLTALPVDKTKTTMSALNTAVEQAARRDRLNLFKEGLLITPRQAVGNTALALVPLALVLALLAFPRLCAGMANGKPVGFLVATCVVGGLVGLFALIERTNRRTKRGDALMNALRAKHKAMMNDKTWSGNDTTALAVALFGTAVLVGSPLDAVGTWFPRRTQSPTTGCGSGCGTYIGCGGTSGSGGGGDGGGGGGCGSGCGGCGGGD